MQKPRFIPLGDSGVLIELGNEISEQMNKKVTAWCSTIDNKLRNIIVEVVPSYCSLLVHYQPQSMYYSEIVKILEKIESEVDEQAVPLPEIIHIPVCYGYEFGVDLQDVAKHNFLSEDEVITIHSEANYLIYMLGFNPGFPYLGGMSDKITMPRLSAPRSRISSGSVGIAGNQTGIYPIDSPGGWRIIGRTPVKLFDPGRENPFLLKASQYIKFDPITKEDYFKISELVEINKYCIKVNQI